MHLLSLLRRGLGRLLVIVAVLVMERMLGLPVITLTVLVLSMTEISGSLLLAVITVLCISSVYDLSATGLLVIVALQWWLLTATARRFSSLTLRVWLLSWVGAVGTYLLQGKLDNWLVWPYLIFSTSSVVLVIKLLAWVKRFRTRTRW